MNINNTAVPMNINSLFPNNTNRKSILGKRKGGVSSYNRAKKRTDLSMVADVERITNDKVNIRLPKTIINELKRINAVSSSQRIEYAGKISFDTSRNGNPQVKFNAPNRMTSGERDRISSEITELIKNYYITYHTHPSASIFNNRNKKYFTLPSGLDFEAYINLYPGMQANIIADVHGYYVIDIIESGERKRLPDAKKINETMEGIRNLPFMKSRLRLLGGYEYFESTITEWKYTITTELNKYMRDNYGVSIKYYSYLDDSAVVTLKRR
jgi:hypothetical protein